MTALERLLCSPEPCAPRNVTARHLAAWKLANEARWHRGESTLGETADFAHAVSFAIAREGVRELVAELVASAAMDELADRYAPALDNCGTCGTYRPGCPECGA